MIDLAYFSLDKALHQFTRSALCTPDIQSLCREAARLVCDKFDIPFCFILGYTDTGLEVLAADGLPEPLDGLALRVNSLEDLTGRYAIRNIVPIQAGCDMGAIVLGQSSVNTGSDAPNSEWFETIANILALVMGKQKAERRLNDIDKRYELVIAASDIGIYDWNLKTNTVFWNDGYYHILGYTPGTIVPNYENFIDLIHPEDRERAIAEVTDHLSTGAMYVMEYRIRHRAGTYRNIQCQGRSFHDAAGQPMRMLGIVTDITDRVQAEIALKASNTENLLLYEWEKRTREINMQLRDAEEDLELLKRFVDEVGKALAVDRCIAIEVEGGRNLPIRVEYKRNPDEISFIGNTPEKPCPFLQQYHYQKPVFVQNTLEPPIHIEASWFDLFRNLKIIGFAGLPVKYGEKDLCTVHIHCAAPRKWTEQEIEFLSNVSSQLAVTLYQIRARKELEKISTHKSHFLSAISHELRSPLNSVIGYTDMLLQEMVGPLNPKQTQYLRNVSFSGKHLLTLINEILDISKIEAGKITLLCEAIEIRPFLQELVLSLQDLARKKSIRFSIDVDPEIIHLFADPTKLRQIFLNLLTNAIKFNKDNGQVGINMFLSSNRSLVITEISDTGIGISQENQANLFSEFYQVDNTYAREQEGTGLGLYLTRKIVEAHAGTITVQSTLGKGSVFTLTLPREPQKTDCTIPPVV